MNGWSDKAFEQWRSDQLKRLAEEMLRDTMYGRHSAFRQYDGHLVQCEDGVYRPKEE